jgi:hypothetical protein
MKNHTYTIKNLIKNLIKRSTTRQITRYINKTKKYLTLKKEWFVLHLNSPKITLHDLGNKYKIGPTHKDFPCEVRSLIVRHVGVDEYEPLIKPKGLSQYHGPSVIEDSLIEDRQLESPELAMKDQEFLIEDKNSLLETSESKIEPINLLKGNVSTFKPLNLTINQQLHENQTSIIKTLSFIERKHSNSIKDPKLLTKYFDLTKIKHRNSIKDLELSSKYFDSIKDPELLAKRFDSIKDPELLTKHFDSIKDPEILTKHFDSIKDPDLSTKHFDSIKDPELPSKYHNFMKNTEYKYTLYKHRKKVKFKSIKY